MTSGGAVGPHRVAFMLLRRANAAIAVSLDISLGMGDLRSVWPGACFHFVCSGLSAICLRFGR